MARELRARFSQGKIEPLESIDLEEGEEVTIVVKERAQALDARRDAIARAAGAWRGTLDFDAFLSDIYENRRRPARDVNL